MINDVMATLLHTRALSLACQGPDFRVQALHSTNTINIESCGQASDRTPGYDVSHQSLEHCSLLNALLVLDAGKNPTARSASATKIPFTLSLSLK